MPYKSLEILWTVQLFKIVYTIVTNLLTYLPLPQIFQVVPVFTEMEIIKIIHIYNIFTNLLLPYSDSSYIRQIKL